MGLFRKEHSIPIPEPFTTDDIRVESSTCTGEKTIGFYDRSLNRLVYAELVRSQEDIDGFYKKYGIDLKGETK